jgi:hypothetical protein
VTKDPLGTADEVRAIRRFTGGRGGQHIHAGGLSLVGQSAKSTQRCKRALDTFLVHAAGRCHTLAEAAENLLVEENRRRAGQALIDHQTDRV